MPAFQRSERTDALVRFLSMREKGQKVSYRELTEIAGREMTSASPNLTVARKILERDHAAIWVCIVPREGIRRLTDPEIAERQRSWWLMGAKNKLTGGARQADTIELHKLNIDQQTRFATDSIMREIALEALARRTRTRVAKVARGEGNELPSFNAIEWMISLSPGRRA